MSILNYVPTFKVIEMNRSTGLVMGHVLSQNLGGTVLTSNTTAAPGYTFIENGIVVGLSNDRTIENFDPEKHAQPFIVFTEELNTYLDALKYFATEKVGGVVYPRAVALYNGDVWTTNNYSGTYTNQTYAKVVGGVLTLQATADAYTLFRVEDSSLPSDGSQALRFTYIGNPLAGTGIIDTITFDMNGGVWDSTTADEVVDVYDGTVFSTVELTPDPTYADHQFDGWYYDATTSTLPVGASDVIQADVTVYAKWLELFDLTFILNGGNIGGDTSSVAVTNVPEGEIILDSAPTPVYADHEFDAWYFEDPQNPGQPDLVSGPVSPAAWVSQDVNIVANWLQLYDITFDGNGGTIDGDTTAVVLDVPEGELIGSIDFGSTPIYEGYEFVSPYWSSTSAEPYVDAASTTVSADTTVYATWSIITYDITYVFENQSEGSGWVNTNPATFDVTDLPITLVDPTNGDINWRFDGWFAEDTYVTEVTTISVVGNVTLYAKTTYIGE